MQEQTTTKTSTAITLDLPPEFMHLCQLDGVEPVTVLRGFIADLCGITGWLHVPRTDGYSCHGSDEREMARVYFWSVGHHWRQGHGGRPHATTERTPSTDPTA
jgi:hypothetical protein